MNSVINLLARFSRYAVNHPRRAWAMALLLVAAALVTASMRLEFRTSNLDLVDPSIPEISTFMNFAESFGTPNVLIIVLEGNDGQALQEAADRIAPVIRASHGVRNVMGRLPLDEQWITELGLERYAMSRDRHSLYIFVQPDDTRSSASAIEPVVLAIRRVLDDAGLEAKGIHPGLTGIPEYALNDKEFIQQDVRKLSLIALAGIAAIFAFGFRSWREPLVAVVTLLVGCVITVGLVSFIPGHLTLLSASFVSILFGLGIDFGVHLIKRIEELLGLGRDLRAAVLEGLGCMYASMLTGALTTSLVFFGMWFSGLRGFAELGLIAGTGVLICFLCMITLLPAGLMLIGPVEKRAAAKPPVLRRVIGASWPVAAGIMALGVLSVFLPPPAFNSDYLALQPASSEAARLERAMISGSGYSPQFAAFAFDWERVAADFADRLLDEPLVGEVRTLAGLSDLSLPPDQVDRLTDALGPQFISSEGRYAVYAYPAGNVWDPDVQEAFVSRMQELDRSVTGMPVIGRYMFEVSERALGRMSAIALGVLVFCLFIDFRSLRLAAAAIAPTLVTFVLMRFWMDVFHLAYNPINIMALPVILGIAVDDGVHIVHRFMQERGNVVATLWGTGRTVVITSLTSMISFGVLAGGVHRGLASFGLLLFIGVSTALAVTVGGMPWLLQRFRRFWLRGVDFEPSCEHDGVSHDAD